MEEVKAAIFDFGGVMTEPIFRRHRHVAAARDLGMEAALCGDPVEVAAELLRQLLPGRLESGAVAARRAG